MALSCTIKCCCQVNIYIIKIRECYLININISVVTSLNPQACTSVLYYVEVCTLLFNNNDNSNNKSNQLVFY